MSMYDDDDAEAETPILGAQNAVVVAVDCPMHTRNSDQRRDDDDGETDSRAAMSAAVVRCEAMASIARSASWRGDAR
jgi:hypothetical protein